MKREARTATPERQVARLPALGLKAIIVGGLCSFTLLVVAIIEGQSPALLEVPAAWVSVAALPALIGLLLSGYIKSLSGPGFGIEAAEQPPIPDLPLVAVQEAAAESVAAPTAPLTKWTQQRAAEYERTRNMVLVHAYKRRESADIQNYDVSIYLARHVSGRGLVVTGLEEVEKAEFYFGTSWRDRVFDARIKDGIMGCKVGAFGPFLALCRVTFASDHASV